MYAYLKSEVGSGHEIWAKTIASGEEILIERVPAFGGSCGNPVWFNQHYKIIYKKAKPDRPRMLYEELWVYDFPTRHSSKIYDGIIGTIFPIVSHNDSLIGMGTGDHFSLIDINGNILSQLDMKSHTYPFFSPDGSKIAYLYSNVDPVSEKVIDQHVRCFNISTREDTDLTPVPGLDISKFRWLDNNVIVY
jgi:hypothetical protein